MKSPIETTKAFASGAKARVNSRLHSLIILGLFAGIYSGFGGLGAQVVQANVSGGIGKVLSSFVFPVGSILIICCGGFLFTGNCLMMIGYRNRNITLRELVRYLTIAYLSNFAGCLAVVLLVYLSGMAQGSLKEIMVQMAVNKISYRFSEALSKGILCAVLVNLGAWLSFAGDTMGEKVVGVFFPTMLFFLCGMEQCITNMYFIPMGMVLSEEVTLLGFVQNLIPVTIGNVIGGGLVVGLGYWNAFIRYKA